ncbi:unnamed protein product [Caenorhabditis bovis]|uniref:Piwi domain-containing protein n=1 Tax=Caenorhabditis bovis TaxID=2654633 RepID=A0A8S1ENJ1_9PELO|nr:unnamed protein product [Caenorhabditis bovis]
MDSNESPQRNRDADVRRNASSSINRRFPNFPYHPCRGQSNVSRAHGPSREPIMHGRGFSHCPSRSDDAESRTDNDDLSARSNESRDSLEDYLQDHESDREFRDELSDASASSPYNDSPPDFDTYNFYESLPSSSYRHCQDNEMESRADYTGSISRIESGVPIEEERDRRTQGQRRFQYPRSDLQRHRQRGSEFQYSCHRGGYEAQSYRQHTFNSPLRGRERQSHHGSHEEEESIIRRNHDATESALEEEENTFRFRSRSFHDEDATDSFCDEPCEDREYDGMHQDGSPTFRTNRRSHHIFQGAPQSNCGEERTDNSSESCSRTSPEEEVEHNLLTDKDLSKKMEECLLDDSISTKNVECTLNVKSIFCTRPDKMIQDTTLGTKTIVQTNYLRVYPPPTDIFLNIYNVTVTKIGKTGENLLKKRQHISLMFWKCVEQYPDVFPPYEDMLFNDSNMLWTKRRTKANDYKTCYSVYNEMKMRIGVVTLTYLTAAKFTVSPKFQSDEEKMLQLIDLIVTARNRCSLKEDASHFYTNGKNTFIVAGCLQKNEFSIPMQFYVGDSVEGWRGMHFAVRPNLRGGILANVDLVSSAFFCSGYPIINLIVEYACGQHTNLIPGMMENLHKYEMSEKNRKNLTYILEGRKLRLTYRKKTIKFGMLTDETASTLFFVNEDNQRVSIADYFESIGLKLKYPNLPCVVPASSSSRGPIKPTYPMEFLTTTEDIKKFNRPLTEKQKVAYIDNAALPPQKRLMLIREMTNKECVIEKIKKKETQASKDRRVAMEIRNRILVEKEKRKEFNGNDESPSSGCYVGLSASAEGPSASTEQLLLDIPKAGSFPPFIDNTDQWMTNFSTEIEKKFLTAKATILPVPALIFGNSRFYDGSYRGEWGTGPEQPVRKVKVVATQGKKTKTIVPAILVIQDPYSSVNVVHDTNLPREQAKLLLNKINEYGQPVYYTNGEPNILCSTTFNQATQPLAHLVSFLMFFREKVAEMVTEDKIGVPFLLCIYANKTTNYNSLRDKFAPDYAIIKSLCDCEIGIYNQGILYETYRTLDDVSQNGTINNLVRKMLAKVGAVQYVLEHGGSHKNWTRLTDPSSPTMVMGIDISHPSAEERLNKESLDSLSIATIVSNVDIEISQFRDSSRVQFPEEEMVVDMVDEMKMRILDFINHSEKIMSHIVIYRDGVSESMFEKIFSEEKEALDAAIRQLRPYYKALNPTITYIMVNKRHHTRFFATKEEDTSGSVDNLKPGTLVEDVITSNKYFDFFLVSQLGKLGTSKPAHYYVLYDDWKPSHAFWQTITHALSYNYASCSNTISLPAPLMYAHVAAKKAKMRALGSRVVQK